MDLVPVTVVGVYMHQEPGQPPQHFVLFRDDNRRRMMIWVGQFEAWAISFSPDGETPSRPFTHDVMLTFLELTGASLKEVHISDLRDEAFYAKAILRVGDAVKEADLRPSDAVALALRAKAPILIAEQIMAACAVGS